MAEFIFLKALSNEENVQAGFRKDFVLDHIPKDIKLMVTGRTFYRVYLNGRFIFHGPARAAHNHSRIDTIDIGNAVVEGNNCLAIEVAGYNQGNQYTTGECSFLFAELEADGKILIGTDSTWYGIRLQQRRQIVERFSHARCSNELYDLDEQYEKWRTISPESLSLHAIEVLEMSITLLERGVCHPEFAVHEEYKIISVFDLKKDDTVEVPVFSYEKEMYKNKPEENAERPAEECMKDKTSGFTGSMKLEWNGRRNELHIIPNENNCAIDLDFCRLSSSFVGIEFSCKNDMVLDLNHADRITTEGQFKAKTDDGCNSVLRLYCKEGRYCFESFEPYSLRYLRIVLRNCRDIKIHRVYLREYQYPETNKGAFLCNDEELNRIYTAARLTFRANTLDVFMDCPGRERGGWLCDSLWMGRVERLMFGEASVNRTMLENFLHSPEDWNEGGIFPSCYPASRFGEDIPNWSMFLVLQLYEYYRFSGDQELVRQYEERLELLVNGLAQFENDEGLLENLKGWVFIDWSSANSQEYKEPISVPTNALYAGMLEAAGLLYGRTDWLEKAEKIKDTIKKNAITRDFYAPGKFFADSLSHDASGKLVPGKFYSEAGQYYCFWLGTADIRQHSDIFKTLLKEYGPIPDCFPSNIIISRANIFIGEYLRFDMLSKYGEYERLLKEIRYLFTYMIDKGPGTLWETLSDSSSVCHGFASHAGVWLMRDYLGLGIPDVVDRSILIAPHPCGLRWAKGSIDTDTGIAALSWSLNEQVFCLSANIPQGYSARIEIPEELRGWKKQILNDNKLSVGTETIEGLTGTVTLYIEK